MSRHRHRPEGETKRERRLQRIVGTGVIVMFLLLGIIVVQGLVQYRSQTNHHASSAKQQTTIIAQNNVIERQNKIIKADTGALVAYHAQTVSILNQIKTLQQEFTSSVGQIPAVAQSLTAGQEALVAKLNDIDTRMTELCAVLPSAVCSSSSG